MLRGASLCWASTWFVVFHALDVGRGASTNVIFSFVGPNGLIKSSMMASGMRLSVKSFLLVGHRLDVAL